MKPDTTTISRGLNGRTNRLALVSLRLMMGLLATIVSRPGADAQSGGPTGWTCRNFVTVRIHNVGTVSTAYLGYTVLTPGHDSYWATYALAPGAVYTTVPAINYASEGCYGCVSCAPGSAVYASWSTNSNQNPTLTTSSQQLTQLGPCPTTLACGIYSDKYFSADFYIVPEGPQPQTPDDTSDGDPCEPACAECEQGMPVWSVSEPYISLWLRDEPLGYNPAIGPRVSLQLAYKQREAAAGEGTFFSFGKKWNFSWLSYVFQDSNTNNVVHFPGGRERTFYGQTEYITNTRLTGDTTNGFTLSYPDGSQDVYGFILTNSAGAFREAFLTERRDPQARRTQLNYIPHDKTADTASLLLKNIVDADGNTTWVYYVTNSGIINGLISKVVDPFGRSVSLVYDNNARLTNITDVAGLSTSFIYDNNDWVTNMTTPYGATTFSITDTPATGTTVPPNGRSILVTEPDGGQQLYVYKDSASGISNSYPASLVPATTNFANTFDNSQLNLRNSFHWGRLQYSHISTNNISYLNGTDFLIARMQHWLISSAGGVSETLSFAREPSPNSSGTPEGQKTWYDYAGKTNAQYEGTQFLPLFTAQVLPDGTSRFTRSDRNSLGMETTNVTTYSTPGFAALRTNILTYATNGIDLLTLTNPLAVQISSNSYNTNHEVLTKYNALGELTSFIYNSNLQVAAITFPSGLITTNIYFASGTASNRLSQTIDYAIIGTTTNYYRTNAYTCTNGLVLTHTDPLGLTVTNTWDNLQRLLRTDYPDGTSVINTYTNLDLVQTTDRIGYTTSYVYNSIRKLVASTNANGTVTRYGYCTCGSLQSVTNAFGSGVQQVTSYAWDLQGNLLQTVGPDSYTLTYNYNALRQLTNTTDGTTSTTNWFNNQGLLIASSNAFGQVSAAIYDALDRATNNVDANGVTITSTYDNLNRILTRGYPDAGVEHFSYTANIVGLTSYTNQLNTNVVNYAYDPLGRKTTETYPGITTNSFTYDSASDLTSLTDGKSQTTAWHFDQFGRTTNKVDAASNILFTYQYDPDNRLTNRCSAAKTNTVYHYDPVGNLTNIVYPVNTNIVLAYDALNRLTSMIDAVGTTSYGYDVAGQLLTEDGPWASDIVSYGYNNRLRTSLTLQAPNASPWTESYVYDAARRLQTLTSPAGSFGYTYDTTRHMQVANLTLPNSGFITNQFDSVARLLSTQLKNNSGTVLNSHAYAYNVASQRTAQTRTEGSYVNYAYDNISQLKTALGFEPGGTTNRLNEQFGYAYDAAGNLAYRTNNDLLQTFSVNSLNELGSISRTTNMTVAGTTTSPATNVTVNTVNAVRYGDSTFARTNVGLVNGNNTFTAIAKDSYGRSDTNSVTLNLPATNSYSYDLNGNLLSDGTRGFDYDDENQLIRITVTNGWKSEFVYDAKMRRRIRREYTWSGSWVQTNEVHYIYDRNLVIQERDANNLPLATYTRGVDLSGSLQGAGGIGGLLARTDNRLLAFGNASAHAYYHADGNGNITLLVNSSQAIVAKYLYDPYGNILNQSGSLAAANLCRFSSKEYHQNSSLVYYLYRFYSPDVQRWLNADPIGQAGGYDLFTYADNSPIVLIDPIGLEDKKSILDYLKWAHDVEQTGQEISKSAVNAYSKGADANNAWDTARIQNRALGNDPDSYDPKNRYINIMMQGWNAQGEAVEAAAETTYTVLTHTTETGRVVDKGVENGRKAIGFCQKANAIWNSIQRALNPPPKPYSNISVNDWSPGKGNTYIGPVK